MNPHSTSDHQASTTDPKGQERRTGRLACEDLRSSLGRVVDLSGEGCRVVLFGIGRYRTGRAIHLTLKSYETSLTVEATIIHRRRLGLFKREIGLQFVRLREDDRKQISQIAFAHNPRYLIAANAA